MPLDRNTNRQSEPDIMIMHKRVPSAHRLCTALAIALFSAMVVPQGAAAEPSAEEILAASRAAMSQPLKYRLTTGGVETVVYQKMLPDGSMASLSETTTPIKRISITYGDKSYELYLEHRVAIDTQFKYQALKGQAASVSSMLGGKAAESSEILGTVQRNGKDCYEIEVTFASEAVAALAKTAPPGAESKMPARFHYIVEKNTYLMVEMQVISENGSLLSKMEYRDVKPQPDLSDVFFLLPLGLEVKKPKSMREYDSLVTNMLSPKMLAVAIDSPPHPEALVPLIAAQPQPGGQVGKIQPQSMSTVRAIGIVVSSMAVLVLLAVFALRHFRKVKTR